MDKEENNQLPEKQEADQEEEYVKVKRSDLEYLSNKLKEAENDLYELNQLNDSVMMAVVNSGLLPKQGETEKQLQKRFQKIIGRAGYQFATNYMSGKGMDFKGIPELKPLMNAKDHFVNINKIVSKYGENRAKQIIEQRLQQSGISEESGESGPGKADRSEARSIGNRSHNE